MRIAVSGSHGTGKSTLIAALLARRPEYVHEPEAFETLGDDVDLSESGGPTADGLRRLLDFTAASLAAHPRGACVVHERSPVDYLAYAAASIRAWGGGDVRSFLADAVPIVRDCLEHLDLIVFLAVSPDGPSARPGEDSRLRRRVDGHLRLALLEDEHDLFDRGSPRVLELPSRPDRQLAELLRLVTSSGS